MDAISDGGAAMTPERFWDLVQTLDGVADDVSCERLGQRLVAGGEVESFLRALEERVASLLAGCRLDATAWGDTGEWVAAAVVAAGRSAYETTLSAGRLKAQDWEWGEAEALLVVGLSDVEERPSPSLDVVLQWKSAEPPQGVEVSGDALGVLIDLFDPGDDPALGVLPTHDPAWDVALARLADGSAIRERRAAVASTALHVVVRDVDEQRVERFADDGGGAVVLVVPRAEIPDDGSRVEAYVACVHRLLDQLDAAP